MYSVVETITPALASEYLAKNTKNRTPKKKAILNYARDMKNGKWELSPQGISFYEDGTLADGQNRLFAILKAGVPVKMYVTYEVPNNCNIQDRGVPRTTSDVLRMSGNLTDAASFEGVALMNALFSFAGRTGVTDSLIEEFLDEHATEVAQSVWAVRSGKRGVANKAPVRAAAFCALKNGVTIETLRTFFDIVNTGFYKEDPQTPAVVLRNYLIGDYSASTFMGRRDGFYVTLAAIADFENKRTRKRVYHIDTAPSYWVNVRDGLMQKYMESYKMG